MNRITLVLVTVFLGLLVLGFAAACGDDGQPAATPTMEEEEEPASEHFTEALEALDKGDLDEVRHHLEDAVEAAESENLPEAKEHAEEGLEALDAGDDEAVREHLEEGLAASR